MKLTNEQLRFLALHARHVVIRWQWFMQDTILRAYTDRDVTSTIGRVAAEQLVAWGLMRKGSGHEMYLTDDGRTACLAQAAG